MISFSANMQIMSKTPEPIIWKSFFQKNSVEKQKMMIWDISIPSHFRLLLLTFPALKRFAQKC